MATYLYGVDWKEKLKVVEDSEESDSENDNDGNGNEANVVGGDDHDPLRPESLVAYAKGLELGAADNGMHTQEITFIKRYVLGISEEREEEEPIEDNFEGDTIATEVEAKAIVDRLSTTERNEIIKLLLDHVHEPHRSSTSTSKKHLIQWLCQANSVRNFWFYKSPGLKALVEAWGVHVDGRKTIDSMRNALAARIHCLI